MAVPPITIFEAAAGTGMLGVGLKQGLAAIGLRAEVVGACEWEATAAAALLAQLEISQGGGVPVFDDAARWFARSAWRSLCGLEPVDAFAAGYPCQPFSHAGRRLGHRDDRHLWPSLRRAIAGFQPWLVWLENVDGHITCGLGKVLRDLQRLGYATACGCFSAEEVGAPHLRKRVFILAIAGGRGGESWPGWERVREAGRRVGDAEHGGTSCVQQEPGSRGRAVGLDARCNELGDAERPVARQGEQGEQGEAGIGRDRRPDAGGELADAGTCREGSADWPDPWNDAAGINSIGCASLPLFPPRRTDYRRWSELVAGGLDPTLMPAVERGLPMVADGMASPADLLRLGGNGVVPLCAAWAFINLLACLMEPVDDFSSIGGLFADAEC